MPKSRRRRNVGKRPKVTLMPPITKGSIDPERIVAAVTAVRDRRQRAEAMARAQAKARANGVAVTEDLK